MWPLQLYDGSSLMSLIVALASAARFVDVLAGHVDLIGSLPGHVMYRGRYCPSAGSDVSRGRGRVLADVQDVE